MKGSKLIVKNTGILYAKTFITMGISLYSTRVILNTLGATDFGIFSLVGGVIAMLTFLNNAMSSATQRFLSYNLGGENKEKLHQIFNASVFLHLIIGLLVVGIIELFGLWAFDHMLNIPLDRMLAAKTVFHFIVISTFFTIITVPYEGIINAHEHMLFESVVGIIQSLGILSIAVIIQFINSDKLVYYGILMAVLTILLLIIRRVYCRILYPESKINFNNYLRKTAIVEMFGYAKYTVLGAVSSMIGFYGIPILVNSFFGTKLNASYGIAGQINGQISIFSSTMIKAMNPQITKSEGGENRNRMMKLTLIGSKMGFILLALFAIPFILDAPYILKIWLKNPPEYAVTFCRMALIVSMFSQLSLPFSNAVNAIGNIKSISIISSIVFISIIPLGYLAYSLITRPASLYFVLILSELTLLFIRIHFLKKYTGIISKDIFINVFIPVLKILSIVLLFTFPIVCILKEGVIRFAIVLFVSTFAFGISTYFYGLSLEERTNAKGIYWKLRSYLLN